MVRVLAAVAGIFMVLIVLLLGAYIEYSTGMPFGRLLTSNATPVARPAAVTQKPVALDNPPATRADVPIVSNARGAEDAARADTPMGETIDLQRCYATMIARRLVPAEAKTVCAKIISGISR